MEELKERLREIRKAERLTQQAFADALGLSLQAIRYYEYGYREPSDKNVNNICATFGISKKWLITGEGEMKEPTGDAKEIADLAKSVMTHTDDRFRLRLVKAITEMSDEDLSAFKDFVLKVTSEEDSRISPNK